MPSTEPAKPDRDTDSAPSADLYEHAAEYGYAVRHGYGPEPDANPVSGTAADARADTLCWLIRDACRSHPDDSTAAILERLASLYRAGADGPERQQSGSGQLQESADLRQPAGRDAGDQGGRG